MNTRSSTTKWTPKRLEKLKILYPIANWKTLLKTFPFSTKRGIEGAANVAGYKRINRDTNAFHRHNETLFDKWTEESAYILGYLEADGYIYSDKKLSNNSSLRVAFCCSIKDRIYLEQLKKITKWTGQTSVRTHKIKEKKYQTVGFTVSSRIWRNFLETRLRKEKIPEDIPDKLLHHYIRGYFDGDGSVFFENQSLSIQSSFVSYSYNWLENLVDILKQKANIEKRTIYQKTSSKKCWYINLAKNNTIKLYDFMYQDASIYLARKKEKFSNESIGSL